jgi:hypothetical protein
VSVRRLYTPALVLTILVCMRIARHWHVELAVARRDLPGSVRMVVGT